MQTEKSLQWFPMRVTYNRELKVKEHLDTINVENFIPLHYEIVGKGNDRKRKLVPAVHNLIFIRSTKQQLTNLKQSVKELEPLRFIVRTNLDGNSEILRIPDKQMENFMRVASIQDDSVMFLQPGDYINKIGRRVLITEGIFAGVEGVIKRFKNNRHVVVQMEGLAAVAITYVPANYIATINE
ncbi:MAG: UpxY family transcription antiterminator [Prevotella sp.]|nr:UpxY family transcription antiterminator [Prevotella sp.]MBP3219889.1 UpxY family transcription antiterminator [Prevotella sp.]